MDKTTKRKMTLVIGKGEYGKRMAEALFDTNIGTIEASEILSCKGTVGDFQAEIIDMDNKKTSVSVSEIAICEETMRVSGFFGYGLTKVPCLHDLSSLADDNVSLDNCDKIVFLLGINKESNPVITEETMRAALTLAKKRKRKIYILATNLKVAGNNLEYLYQKTRKAGVVYVKFTETLPEIAQNKNKIEIKFYDEISGQNFLILPDALIVDDTILPSGKSDGFAKILYLDQDSSGFIQGDNIHRLPVMTNRKGIFAVGPARKIGTKEKYLADISNVVLAISKLRNDDNESDKLKAKINTDNCVYCLTCFRICRHKAIIFDPRPIVVANACEGCGICVAECPKSTISIVGISGYFDIKPLDDSSDPVIVAFCCKRSAYSALQSIEKSELPDGFIPIEVPCAGSVSIKDIYLAFQKGADGVILLTCHTGNCYSEAGNLYAKKRVEYIAGFLDSSGIGKEKISLVSLASNMENQIAAYIRDFAKKLTSRIDH